MNYIELFSDIVEYYHLRPVDSAAALELCGGVHRSACELVLDLYGGRPE